MTSAEEIQAQVLKEDIEPYLNKVYDGHVPVELIEQFRIAMMYLPVTAHKYSLADIETISERHPNEVTNREVGMALNAIFAVPFASMYQSLEEAIAKTKRLEKLKEEYNKSSAAFDRKCKAKFNRLMKLSGIGNSTPMNNGMKIIPGPNS